MGFISKEELEEKAKKYDIDLDKYESWSDKQKAVADAEKEFGVTEDAKKEYVPIMISVKDCPEEILAANYKPGKVRISTEIPTLKCNVMKYEEELGDAYDTSDMAMSLVMFDGDDRVTEMSRTYEIRKKAGKKVIAESTAPTVNTGLYYDPTEGWFPIVEFNGRKGYLFTHHKLSQHFSKADIGKSIKICLMVKSILRISGCLVLRCLHAQFRWSTILLMKSTRKVSDDRSS